jgi:hypothetical protein
MALARRRRTNHQTAQVRPFFDFNQQSMMMRFAWKDQLQERTAQKTYGDFAHKLKAGGALVFSA